VLIVMEHRNPHPRPQLGLDREAFRRLDVLQVDGAERRLQRGHHVAEAGRIGGIHLDVEHVDAGELLEQDRLALHHRLAGQRADIAETQHGGAVGDHRDQVAARRVVIGGAGVGLDRLARRGNAGGVGKREVALRRHALGRLNGELSRMRQAMIVKRGLAEIVVHCFRSLPL
jgi:hypothetical protein